MPLTCIGLSPALYYAATDSAAPITCTSALTNAPSPFDGRRGGVQEARWSRWTIPTATTFAPLVSAFDDGVCRVYRARASGGAGNELSHYSYSFGFRIVTPSPLGPCQYILFSMLRPSMKVDAHFCGASRQKAFACPQRAYIIHILSIRSVER